MEPERRNKPIATEEKEKQRQQSIAEVAASAHTAGTGAVVPMPGTGSTEVIYNSYDVELIKGRKAPSSAWLHAPAFLELLRTADDRLTRVSEMRGATVRCVTKVRAAKVRGKRVVYIVPTHDEDPDGIPVRRYGAGAWINLVTLLAPAKQTVPKGYRDRYAVDFAPENSPVGPALMINLARPTDRKFAKKNRPPAEAPQQEPAPVGD